MTDPIDEHAQDAIINRMWSHTVGVVNEKRLIHKLPTGAGYDEEQPGTGSVIRWGNHRCILTAKHVIEEADKDSLRFFFRPIGTLDRKSREEIERQGYVESHSGWSAEIYDIHRCDWEDIAVLTINPSPSYLNAEFHELQSGWVDPSEDAGIYSFGFPTHDPVTIEVVQTGKNKEERTLGLSPMIWESTVIPKPSTLIESYSAKSPYDPAKHFLAPWTFAENGKTPHGFSGAAVWCLGPIANGELWLPKMLFAGMSTLYYPSSKLERMIRASTVVKVLEEALGSG